MHARPYDPDIFSDWPAVAGRIALLSLCGLASLRLSVRIGDMPRAGPEGSPPKEWTHWQNLWWPRRFRPRGENRPTPRRNEPDRSEWSLTLASGLSKTEFIGLSTVWQREGTRSRQGAKTPGKQHREKYRR